MTDETEFSKTQGPSVPDRLRAELDRAGLSQAVAARLIGISPAVVSQFLAGSYPGDVAGIAAKVTGWLQRQARTQAMARVATQADSFAMTPIAEQILSSLHMVQGQRDPAATMIAGAPGVGKTATIRHFAATNSNVWLITAVNGAGRPIDLVKALARELRLGLVGLGVSDTVAKIEEATARTGGVFIVDEAQHLSKAALDTARGIYEQCSIHLALCGDLTLVPKTDAMPQLNSRLLRPVVISRVSAEDVAIVAAQFGVTDPVSVGRLCDLAAKNGRLRRVEKVLRLAAASMDSDGAPDLEAIEFAIAYLQNQERGAA